MDHVSGQVLEFPRLVRAELNLEMPDRAGYVEIVRRWLDDGSRLLTGDLRREMEEKPPPRRGELTDLRLGWPNGAAGGINLLWDVKRTSTRNYKPGTIAAGRGRQSAVWPGAICDVRSAPAGPGHLGQVRANVAAAGPGGA